MDADTVDFSSERILFPKVTSGQCLRQAATDILAILQSPDQTIPSLSYDSAFTNV